jgi:hypothetical protein
MLSELPALDDRLFLTLYRPANRGIDMVSVNLVNGAIFWRRDLGVTLPRYQYGDLLTIDTTKGVLDLFLPQVSRHNRVSVAIDGSKVRHFSYRGYFWPIGIRKYGDLVLGFDGEPLSMTAVSLLALDESTGSVRWRVPAAGHRTAPPAVVRDVLVFASTANLEAIDLPTGRRRWATRLRGEIPPRPTPPMIRSDYILVTQQMPGKSSPYADWLFARHSLATGVENGVVQLGERPMAPRLTRSIGPLFASEGDVWVDIVDPTIPALRASMSFEGTFSRLVFATPRVSLGSSDDRGFLVVTSDGKLRYYELPPPATNTRMTR